MDRSSLINELVFALDAIEPRVLRRWSLGVVKNLGINSVRRGKNFFAFADKVLSGTWDEVRTIADCSRKKEFKDYFIAKNNSMRGGVTSFRSVLRMLKKNPKQGALYIATFVLGAGIGSGGVGGDGGLPDLDIAMGGIGAHRSIEVGLRNWTTA